jgi:hypothetical protein
MGEKKKLYIQGLGYEEKLVKATYASHTISLVHFTAVIRYPSKNTREHEHLCHPKRLAASRAFTSRTCLVRSLFLFNLFLFLLFTDILSISSSAFLFFPADYRFS